MRIAAKVAQDKLAHPEQFCPTHRCLWRTGDGSYCPRHTPAKKEAPCPTVPVVNTSRAGG